MTYKLHVRCSDIVECSVSVALGALQTPAMSSRASGRDVATEARRGARASGTEPSFSRGPGHHLAGDTESLLRGQLYSITDCT
ncbi:hypothetical protein J6590_040397 [Homalodisca vitripennis]|nr:hypothetical protein J6590_040397 [Homalodisca vitripennis]